MKYNLVFYILFIIASATLQQSCTPGSCQEKTLATCKAGFYETGSGKALTADSVTLYGLGMESTKIYNKALNMKSIEFPLNASADTSIFVLKVNGHIDTVSIVYTSYPHLVSKECGFSFYHVLDTVFDSRPELDFLKKNQNVTTLNEENIRIFY